MKNIWSLLLAAAVILSLAACGKQTVETTNGDKSLSDWLTEDKVAVIPGSGIQVKPIETEPPETKPAETEPVTVGTVTVTDADYKKLDGHQSEYWCACKHLPMILVNGEALETVNAALADRFALELEDDYSCPGLTYTWSQWDNYLSLVLRVQRDANDQVNYFVYNVDLLQDRFLDNNAVYTLNGYTPQSGTELLKNILQSRCDLMQPSEFFSQELVEQMVDLTMSQDNIDKSQVFVSADGTLNFALYVAVPAGSGWSQGLYDANGEPYRQSMADHLECE